MNLETFINSIKPGLESFFVGLIAALLEAAFAYLTSAQAFDWRTLSAALVAGGLNYATSKARYLEQKKSAALIKNSIDRAIATDVSMGDALQKEMRDG